MAFMNKTVSAGLTVAILAGVASITQAQDDKKKIVQAHKAVAAIRASDELKNAQQAVERASKQVAKLRAQLAELQTKYKRGADIITATNAELAIVEANRNRAWGSLGLLLKDRELYEYPRAKSPFKAGRALVEPKTASRTIVGKKFHAEHALGLKSAEKPTENARFMQSELGQQPEMSVAAMQREILGMMREMRRDVREMHELVESLRRDRARRPRAPESAR